MCFTPKAPKSTAPQVAPETPEPVLKTAGEATDVKKRKSAAEGTNSLRIQTPTSAALTKNPGLQIQSGV